MRRQLIVDGTYKTSAQCGVPRFLSSCPALPVSPDPYPQGSRESAALNWTRAFPGNGSRGFRPGAPAPRLDRAFLLVAYPPLEKSRLGCSPNGGLNAAYHTTSCRYRENTNQCLDKKSGRPPIPAPARCPVAQQQPHSPRTRNRQIITKFRFITAFIFLHRLRKDPIYV